MVEKFVVIGSNSFSGSSFVSYLLEQGAHVAGISRSQEPNAVFLPYKWRDHDAFKFYQLDLNNNLSDIMGVINDLRADYVVNFAAQSMVGESWLNPEHWFQTNVMANVRFHEALRKCSFLKKYVHVSTPEVYGTCHGLIEEHTNYNPSTPYAVSRAAADMSLMSLYKAYDFPVVFTRAANVYGPGQQLYRIIPRAALYFLLGKKLQLHGGGHSVRSFIHIRDVADGTLRIARNAELGEVFHLSTTQNISIRDLVELIARRMNVSFDDHVEIVDERLGKGAAYLLDSSKVRSKLKWTDRIPLENGIDESIAWVRNNIDILRAQPFEYIHKP